jgi:Fe-S cluster assembly protein SufD
MTSSWLDLSGRESEPSWLSERRKSAGASFDELGFPTTRLEPWRHTNIRPWVTKEHTVAPATSVNQSTLDAHHLLSQTAARLVFVNGRYQAELSQSNSFASAISGDMNSKSSIVSELLGGVDRHESLAMSALNLACFSDGALIILPENKLVEDPIELVFFNTGSDQEVTHQRVLVAALDGSMATIVTHYIGLSDSAYFANTVSEFHVGIGAGVKNVVLQREGPGALHLSSTVARLNRNANFESWVASLGGQCARNEIHVALDGERAHCQLEGLYLANNSQSLDHYTNVEHRASQTESNELYKGVVDGKAKGSFQARVHIFQGATQCVTHQLNRNLLLSKNGEVNTKPQLEIDNDDVKATHGATVGQLDDEALYYLRSRGLSALQARTLLVDGFVREVAGRLTDPRIKEVVNVLLEQALGNSANIAA